MELTRYQDIERFYARAESFLVEHEAEHNLILGLTTGLIHDGLHLGDPPYLATVEDDGGRVIAVALRTPPHNLILSLAPPNALHLITSGAHDLYPNLPGVLGPKDASRSFAEIWKQISHQPYRLGISQRIYQLETVTPVSGVPGEFKLATLADRSLLIEWFAAFDAEALGLRRGQHVEQMVDTSFGSSTRGIALWHDGQPVSMAGYSGPTPNGIRVGRVYTPPHLRSQGYASACVAALSQHLLDSGRRYCFLFTDLSNPTSNHIYQTIGYHPVADVDEYVLLESAPQ